MKIDARLARGDGMPPDHVDFDLADPATHEDPYGAYQALQRHRPVAFAPSSNQYLVATYDHVREVLVDHSTFSNEDTYNQPYDIKVLVTADEPAHGRQRRLVSRAFTPRRVAALEPFLRDVAHELIDSFVDTGSCDLVERFAFPLPVIAISQMLGIPADDRDDFKRWADDLFLAVGDPSHFETAKASLMELGAYVLGKKAEREALLDAGRAPDDLLTGLVEAGRAEEPLPDDEFVIVAMQLLAAGHETTTNLIGNAVYALCTNADQMALLLADHALCESAVEEALRFEAPVQGLWRRTTRPCTIADVDIPFGGIVQILFAAANRDPCRWSHPDRFDIARDPEELQQHLAFGFGIHSCLGAALARLEGRVALEALLTRLPGLALDPCDAPSRGAPTFTRGFSRLPVTWDRS